MACTILFGANLLAYSSYPNDNKVNDKMTTHKKRIVLLGASVGQQWNLPELPRRIQNDHFIFESKAVYQYDKTEALEEVLMRPKRKFHLTRTYLTGFLKPPPQPVDMIIIKECAAYFPGNMKTYKDLVQSWIKKIQYAKIEVALATVVPVTKERADKEKGKMEAIREYNEWIREYSNKENILLLDLESALRTNDQNRFLRNEFSSDDGLHLNKRAYEVLDHLIQTTFEPTS